MPIDWIYRDAVAVGTFANSLLMTGATLRDDVQGPPPPKKPPNSPLWSCCALHSPNPAHCPISAVKLPIGEQSALQSLGFHGMPIH